MPQRVVSSPEAIFGSIWVFPGSGSVIVHAFFLTVAYCCWEKLIVVLLLVLTVTTIKAVNV